MFTQRHLLPTVLVIASLFISACNKKSDSDGDTATPPVEKTPTNQQPTLVVLLEFKLPTFQTTPESWQEKIFSYKAGSVNDYYYEVSGGDFGLSPVTNAGNVHDGIVSIHFDEAHPNSGVDHYERAEQSIKKSIEQISQNGFDFSIYDKNHDNKISSKELTLVFVVAGAESSTMHAPSPGVGALTTYLNQGQVPTVNGVTLMEENIGKYFIMGELHYTTIQPVDASIGIIAHELGHAVFDLPDLYDTVNDTNGIGMYGLMGSGEWTAISDAEYSGDTPTHMSAWSKVKTGWYTPEVYDVNDTKDITLHATGTQEYNIVRINVTNDEYFLLENRGNNGFDRGLRYANDNYIFNGGLAIWHIDESIIRQNPTHPNDNAQHKGVDLEEADNSNSLDDTNSSNDDPSDLLYYSGHNTKFTPSSLPNSNLYDHTVSGLYISNISVVGNSMTLKIGQ